MRDPPHRHLQKPRAKAIDPYKDYLVKRWEEGCHDRGRLYREIRDMGYQHSESNVFRLFGALRQLHGEEYERVGGPSGTSVRSPSAIHVASLLVRRPEELDQKQARYLERLCELDEEVRHAYELTQEFCSILRGLEGERLGAWLRAVERSRIDDLQRFALSIEGDYEAVKAGLTLSWSNGQTEGNINRLNNVSWDGFDRRSLPSSRSG